jgi:hypothetical protein
MEDSAKRREVLGTWGFHSHMDFTRMSYQEANVWFFEQIFNFLRSVATEKKNSADSAALE